MIRGQTGFPRQLESTPFTSLALNGPVLITKTAWLIRRMKQKYRL